MVSIVAVEATTHARAIEGTVFVDRNGDGALSRGDEPVAGVIVVWETTAFARTDARGRYRMRVPERDGIVWARTPDGFEVAPSFAAIRAGSGTARANLALRPSRVTGPATFVITSDTHIGRGEYGRVGEELDGADLAAALSQATDLEPAPHFFAITGDMAQSNRFDQFDVIADVTGAMPAPFVPVPGNHDWTDGGYAYREWFGPPMYSFDAGGAHFVVLNDNDWVDTWTEFLRRDLALTSPGTLVVAFVHRPPDDPELDALAAAGVDYLFTGHWHSNEVFERGGMIELSTEPLIRGGMDTTPAGYRIATVVDGALHITHAATVETPVVAPVHPRPGACVNGPRAEIIAAAHMSASAPTVTALIDDTTTHALAHAGGWAYSSTVPVLPGAHTLTLRAVAHDGSTAVETTSRFTTCDAPTPVRVHDWPQLGGSAMHRGAAMYALEPPLRTRWTVTVGGHVHGGAPAVADGRVFVAVTDFADGRGGAVAAHDARTGERLWRFEPGTDVRSSPSVAEGVVVVPTLDGKVYGLEARTGATRWVADISDGIPVNAAALKAPAAIDDGVVYIGAHQRFVALDLHTGVQLWTANPAPERTTLTSYAAVGVADGLVVGAFGRGRGGLHGWDVWTGVDLWRMVRPDSLGVHASPVMGAGVAYVANAAGQVFAVELATGAYAWSRALFEGATYWDYAVTGTPALAHDRLYVPTQYDWLLALDARTGDTVWRARADVGLLHASHARAASRGFGAAPVVTGDVVWIAGADGILRAFDAHTGDARWTYDLGVPVTSGLAPAGDLLIVATFDGTLRALQRP